MTRRIALLVVVFVVLPGAMALAATPPPITGPPLPDGSVFDPRRIPSVSDAEAALEAAHEARDAAVARVAQVEGDQSQCPGRDRPARRIRP